MPYRGVYGGVCHIGGSMGVYAIQGVYGGLCHIGRSMGVYAI